MGANSFKGREEEERKLTYTDMMAGPTQSVTREQESNTHRLQLLIEDFSNQQAAG